MWESSEFSDHEYLSLMYSSRVFRSDLKSKGSDKKMSEGLNMSMKCLRLNKFLLKFSIFHVIETSLSGAPVMAGLSDPGRLNYPAPFRYHSL